MITDIQKVIVEKLHIEDISLSFLKYSTPTSGRKPDDKVMFFVFKAGATEPFLCVKTVRSYSAKDTIIKNFNTLKQLNTLTVGSPFSELFARALYLHDDGDQIFSIESVCKGRKISLRKEKLSQVVHYYTRFQQHVVQTTPKRSHALARYVQHVVDVSKIKDGIAKKIIDYSKTLSLEGVQLPVVLQHGDMTEDNILIAEKSMHIVDCDFAGMIDLPGFDLFGLFYRYDPEKALELSYRFLPGYFRKIDAHISKEKYKGLLFVYFITERILRKPYLVDTMSIEDLISQFEDMFRR